MWASVGAKPVKETWDQRVEKAGDLVGGVKWQDPCKAGFHLIQYVRVNVYGCMNCKMEFHPDET